MPQKDVFKISTTMIDTPSETPTSDTITISDEAKEALMEAEENVVPKAQQQEPPRQQETAQQESSAQQEQLPSPPAQQFFFDTSALLNLTPDDLSRIIIASRGTILLSFTTLSELENIKTSRAKSESVKAAARAITYFLDSNPAVYTVVPPSGAQSPYPQQWSGDYHIVSDYVEYVIDYYKEWDKSAEPVKHYFITDDLCCANLARVACSESNIPVLVFHSRDVGPTVPQYLGYSDLLMNDEEMAQFYADLGNDPSTIVQQGVLRSNEYLLIDHRNKDDSCDWHVDAYVNRDGKLVKVDQKRSIDSRTLGKIKPKDIFQQFAIDSILNNTLTFLTGRAGSGKSLVSLATIMYLIDKGKYDKVIIMTNPIKARGASDTGFLPGTNNEKLLGQSIGNMLTSKFGDRIGVELLINDNKLQLVNMADVRGMEIRDNEILYITEAQNMSVDLMKLCLSRASSGCKIVIEGDFETQVDSPAFEGTASGLKRCIDKLCGDPAVGYVHLPNVWRSKIAQLVERL